MWFFQAFPSLTLISLISCIGVVEGGHCQHCCLLSNCFFRNICQFGSPCIRKKRFCFLLRSSTWLPYDKETHLPTSKASLCLTLQVICDVCKRSYVVQKTSEMRSRLSKDIFFKDRQGLIRHERICLPKPEPIQLDYTHNVKSVSEIYLLHDAWSYIKDGNINTDMC